METLMAAYCMNSLKIRQYSKEDLTLAFGETVAELDWEGVE